MNLERFDFDSAAALSRAQKYGRRIDSQAVCFEGRLDLA